MVRCITIPFLLIAFPAFIAAGGNASCDSPAQSDASHLKREAKKLRDEAEELRRMAYRLDRKLEDVEDVAVQLQKHLAEIDSSLQLSSARLPADSSDTALSNIAEHTAVILRARKTADELALKARDLSRKIREMEELADRKEEGADRLDVHRE